MATQDDGRFTLKALRRDGPPRKFTLELSLGGLVTLGVAVIIGLIWVFIFGIIVGRGYRPEQAVPEIAKIMPDSGRAPVVSEPPRVLQPEDLKFHDALRRDEPATLPADMAAEERPAGQARPVKREEIPVVAAPVKEDSASASPAVGPRFRWMYQAASFKERTQAEALLRKIEALGLPGGLEQANVSGEPWFRVLVTVKGSEADNEKALNGLATLGLHKPLLRKRDAL